MKELYKSEKTVEIFKQQNNVMAVTHRSFSSYHSVPVTYRSLVGIEVAYIKLYEVISGDTTERTNIYYMHFSASAAILNIVKKKIKSFSSNTFGEGK